MANDLVNFFKKDPQFKTEKQRVAELNSSVAKPKPIKQKSGAARTSRDITPVKSSSKNNLFGAVETNQSLKKKLVA